MQSLEPTGTRLLLLIKGITQTGPSVPAESGGCPLFTPSEGRVCKRRSTRVSLLPILLKVTEALSRPKIYISNVKQQLLRPLSSGKGS